MKFSLSWLKKYIETSASFDVIAEKLTSIGFEVESISCENDKFVIAYVSDVVQHPDPKATKLKLCKVFDGKEEFSVVCGASNVRSGMKAVFAKEGAIIPANGMVMKSINIRGADSFGMLCSGKELCISSDGDGILDLSSDPRGIGELFFDIDPVFDINVLPNRGDCLGVYNIARELSVAGLGMLKPIDIVLPESKVKFPFKLSVSPENTSISFRMISGVNNEAKTPDYIVKSLELSGIKSISPVVDISNYVMLVLSSPIHVYDADKIESNEINVKFANSISQFCAINGVTYNLSKSDLVVCDAKEHVLCLAGVMGGQSSCCSKNTKNIIIECGAFDRDLITRTIRNSGISTASGFRFERGVDPCGINRALDLSTSLILEVCGGNISNIESFGAQNYDLQIEFSIKKCEEICSAKFFVNEILNIFIQIGCRVEVVNDDLINVFPSSYRQDLQNFYDLTEEIIRFVGYDRIVEKAFFVSPLCSQSISLEYNLKSFLAFSGMDEVITWSFANSNLCSKFGDVNENMYLAKPPSAELDVMRNSIAPNMIKLLTESCNNGRNDIAIFEIGKIFGHNGDEYTEHSVIAGLRSGKVVQKSFYKSDRDFDFFDVKADVLSILSIIGFDAMSIQFERSTRSQYSKWESAECFYNGELVAHFGRIHPLLLDDIIKSRVFYFEVPFIGKRESRELVYSLSKYQSVRRDFSFFINHNSRLGDILSEIRGMPLVKDVSVVDIYSDHKLISADKVSILISVTIGSNERTLVSSEIENTSNLIMSCISSKYAGEIRCLDV